jgi:hypothetical protein
LEWNTKPVRKKVSSKRFQLIVVDKLQPIRHAAPPENTAKAQLDECVFSQCAGKGEKFSPNSLRARSALPRADLRLYPGSEKPTL